MKKILVPCDFSPSAYEAYQFAIDIASATGGSVSVLNVIEISSFTEQPTYLTGGHRIEWLALVQELEERAHKDYGKMKNEQPAPACPVDFVVKQGRLFQSIRSFVTDNSIDLVVMGTQGATGWKEFFVGSNTEKIVRTSEVPVIAVRKAPAVSVIQNIVVPIDLDLNQHDWIGRLKALQDFFQATLHLLYVNTSPEPSTQETKITAEMKAYVTHYQLKDYTLNVRNSLLEQDGILGFTDEINADMVAMATHGRRGLSFLISGSIAEKIVNRVACPIWTSVLNKK